MKERKKKENGKKEQNIDKWTDKERKDWEKEGGK